MRMVEYEASTDLIRFCVQFKERKNESVWIDIVSKNGCYSNTIGLKKGRLEISLEIPYCLRKDIVAHELMHALGF